MTMNSEEFLHGITFLQEVGIPLTAENIPGIIKAADRIAQRSAPVAQILGLLEAAVDADFPERLMERLPQRIAGVVTANVAVADVRPTRPSPVNTGGMIGLAKSAETLMAPL